GWWNGVTTGDFDADGKLDIIASNWGLNSSWHSPSPQEPARAYFGDFDGNGTVEFIEAFTDSLTHRILPRRSLLAIAAALPPIRDRFPTHAGYAMADVNAILGPSAASAREVQANTIDTQVFLNCGDHFYALLLQYDVSFSAAYGV